MMKRVIICGDLHGRNSWREINPELYDKIILLGDYVDSYDVKNIDMIDNLKEIIAFKKAYYNKVILLLGNHCISYLYQYEGYICSGFRPAISLDLYDLYNKNIDLFQIAFQYKNYIFSHAGITNKWAKTYKKDINAAFKALKIKFKLKNKNYTLVEKINWLQYSEWGRQLIFSFDSIRSGNPLLVGGCLWVDRLNSRYDSLTGFHQFVGHTPVTDFETYGHGDTTITYCDVLGSKKEFKIIEI